MTIDRLFFVFLLPKTDEMKKETAFAKKLLATLLVCLSVALFPSCDKEGAAIHRMCREIHSQYPQATLQDVYKTCYQDYFGAEHLVTDTAAARFYLHQEIEECRGTDMSAMPTEEPTGFRHRFSRVNLSNVTNGELTEEQILADFLNAAGKDNAYGDDWQGEWDKIAAIALEVNPDWADTALQAELQDAARGNHPVRHSDAFRNAYNPHYRIVKR